MEEKSENARLLVDGLKPKLRLMVLEYMVHKNKAEAVRAAGFSKHTASSIASQYFAKPEVMAAVDELMLIERKKLQLTADQVGEELARVGIVDPAQLFDDNGNYKPIHLLPEDIRRAISGVEMESVPYNVEQKVRVNGKIETRTITKFATRIKSIKFWSKTEALGLLGKKHRMFPNATELAGKGGGPIETKTQPIDMSKLSQAALEKLAELKDE